MARKKAVSSETRWAVGLALAVLLGGAGVGAWLLFDPNGGDPNLAALNRLAKDPAYTAELAELQKDYPQDYASYRAQVLRQLANEATKDSQRQMLVRQYTDDLMTQYAYRGWNDAYSGSDQTMAALAARRLDTLTRLQAWDVNTCGRVAAGVRIKVELPQTVATAMSEATAATLRLSHEGKTAPVKRAFNNADDEKLMLDGLHANGLTDADIDVIKADGSRDGIPRDQSCRIGIALYRTLGGLPAEARGRLTAQAMMGPGWGMTLHKVYDSYNNDGYYYLQMQTPTRR